MKKILLALLVAIPTVYAQNGNGQNGPKKKTVAVIDFQSSEGLSKGEVSTLTNRFRGILVKTNAFSIVEREKMNDVLKQQDFNISDQCNTSECAAEVGKLLGVDLMIAGDIGKIGDTYTIDLRLINVSTGQIVQSETQDYTGKIDGLLAIMATIANSFASVKPAAAVKNYKLNVTAKVPSKSKPGDISFFIDEVQVGTKSLKTSLPEGSHALRVTAASPDLEPFTQIIQLTQDTKIEADLKFTEAYLKAEMARQEQDRKIASVSSGSSNKMWYYIGGAAVLVGTTVILLSGGGSSQGSQAGIDVPILPNE